MNAFVFAVLTACVWGVVPIIEKLGLVRVSPLVGLFYRSMGVVTGLFILGAYLLKKQEIKAVDMRSVALLMLAGFLASFVGQILFYKSLKLGEVSKVVPISGTYPLIAFVLGVLLLGESVTLTKVAGIFCVLGGIWLLR